MKPHSLVLVDGERFATLFEKAGVPAYYPTCYALNLRQRNLSHNTILSYMKALAHILVFADDERINLNSRIENGEFLSSHEIGLLAEACGVTSASLKRVSKKGVLSHTHKIRFRKNDLVTANQKSVRLTVAAEYLEMISRMSEAGLSQLERKKGQRAHDRQEMVRQIAFFRPKVKTSTKLDKISPDALGKVTKYILSVTPENMGAHLWKDPILNCRNWCVIRTLLETGIRNSELLQLKVTDLNFREGILTVYRRPDDPEDPRINEPNAKTSDRHIPISDTLCEFLEAYVFGAGSKASELSGTPFVFLSHSNRNCGSPLTASTIRSVVGDLGNSLDIVDLSPHDLRHGWMQNLAEWSLREGIEAAEFDRLANRLGGWSHLSKMASHYRGDQLTEAAYQRGLQIENSRL